MPPSVGRQDLVKSTNAKSCEGVVLRGCFGSSWRDFGTSQSRPMPTTGDREMTTDDLRAAPNEARERIRADVCSRK
jgi:hypothetical protein